MKRPLLLILYQCSFWDEKIRSPNKIPMVSRVDIKVTAIFIRALSILFKPKKKKKKTATPSPQQAIRRALPLNHPLHLNFLPPNFPYKKKSNPKHKNTPPVQNKQTPPPLPEKKPPKHNKTICDMQEIIETSALLSQWTWALIMSRDCTIKVTDSEIYLRRVEQLPINQSRPLHINTAVTWMWLKMSF